MINGNPDTVVVGPLPQLNLFGLHFPTYYIFMSAMLTILAVYIFYRADRKQVSVTTALDVFIVSVVSGAIGARIFHVLYEEPMYYWEHPLRVLFFWQGGFVYYAGLLAGILGAYVTLKIKKESFVLWADFLTPVVSLGYALGRISCFFEGCCYGKVCDWPWAYSFAEVNTVTGLTLFTPRHPTQLYAFTLEALLFLAVRHFEKTKTFAKRAGSLFMFWLFFHALSRIIVELFRDDDRGFFIAGMSISTIISLCLILTSAFYFLRKRK